MKIKLWKLTLIFNIFLIVAFSVLCVCFIPNFADYLDEFFAVNGHTFSARTLVYGFSGSIAVPCVVLLALSLSLSIRIKNDSIFTIQTALRLATVAYIMMMDCAVFFIGTVALFCLGELTFSPLFAIIDLIGFALSVLLLVLSGYIRRAAGLKEEVDATL